MQERSVLPKYNTRVSPVIRPAQSSAGSGLDCSSNSTLVTNASPFNSQTALIAEKKYFIGDTGKSSTNHYYAENLRNNHQKALTRIYNPLDKNQDVDYKQLDPLLPNEQSPSIKILMDSQEIVKPPKDEQEPTHGMISMEYQKKTNSYLRYACQVSFYLSSIFILFIFYFFIYVLHKSSFFGDQFKDYKPKSRVFFL